MKSILSAIAATLLATAAAQAAERNAEPARERTQQSRMLDERLRDRAPVSLERAYETQRPATPDAAYRTTIEWSGNDNEG
ncbi:hypothetical protein [Methylopila sp. 73B]|uniref:hypothetical protein n=1 Tax=Methylopila sp. 73B TaxID=1120792 RepID=UPI00035F0B6D|nr:hypothetical protein [Methylopila sp. 73B]